ncbi:MAG: 50S ribosomal protein L19 [Anaerolineales bacterium]
MAENQVADKLSGWNAEPTIPDIRPGDTVRVQVRIVEGGRERLQAYQGVVMRMRHGRENGSFTVRRIAANGIGVERTFLMASPRIERVEVLRRAKVRRAQLYYLRKYRGKAARLKEDRSGLSSAS